MYKLLAGAPFDQDNLFLRPAIDGGLFVNPFPTTLISRIDGGRFNAPATFVVDGGYIPAAGTATYDPNKTYDETSIVVIEG